MCRTMPCSLSSASVAQPSSMSATGSGQWIWYRSMASTPSRRRLPSPPPSPQSRSTRRPPRARVRLRQHRVAIEAVPDVAGAVVEQRALGEHVRSVGDAAQRTADGLLGPAEAVGGCRVDPVAPEVEAPVDRCDRLVVGLRSPPELPAATTDRPGAETDPGDLHARRAQRGGKTP